MKRIRKRVLALGAGLAMLASSAMSMSASAWDITAWPGDFTPEHGRFYANAKKVRVSNLQWSSEQVETYKLVDTFQYGVEFEFRPSQNPHTVWDTKTGESSNLPFAYFEFQPDDDDDIAICCGDLKYLKSDTTYYGSMELTKQSSFSTANLPYTFESEYGMWVPIISGIYDDYKPMLSAYYNDQENNVRFEGLYSW